MRRTPIDAWARAEGRGRSRMSGSGSARGISRATARTCTPRSRANAGRCATSVGIFDASTLGKIEVVGPDAAEFLERMYINAFKKLAVGRCRYGVLLNEAGFIIDDGVIGRVAPDRFHVTTTTGGAARVLHMMEDYRQTEFPDLKVWLTSTTEQWAVIAVQGPRARDVLAPLVEGIDLAPAAFPHMGVRDGRIGGVERACSASVSPASSASRSTCRRTTVRRLGGGLARSAAARRLRLRHRGDARAARREGLHHRRPGDRRHGDAGRCRPRLGDRQGQARFRRQALAVAAGHGEARTASSSSAC